VGGRYETRRMGGYLGRNGDGLDLPVGGAVWNGSEGTCLELKRSGGQNGLHVGSGGGGLHWNGGSGLVEGGSGLGEGMSDLEAI
jgi:hypothetical protein